MGVFFYSELPKFDIYPNERIRDVDVNQCKKKGSMWRLVAWLVIL